MAVTIQVRRDTAANWTSVNPVLHQGEPGLETDTGKVKIGDGSTAWTSLAYEILPLAQLDARYAKVYSPMAYGAAGNGTTDDTTAVLAAFTAAGSAGGIVDLGTLTFLTSSAIPLVTGTRIRGSEMGGGGALVNNTSDLFSLTGTVSSFTIENCSLTASAGHIVNCAASSTVAFGKIRACTIIQSSASHGIWYMPNGTYLNMHVGDECTLVCSASATVAPWYIVGLANSNTWQSVRATAGTSVTVPFFWIECDSASAFSSGNTFRDVVAEECVYGIIHALTVSNLTIEQVLGYDVTGSYSASLFYVGTGTGGGRSQDITCRNSGRIGGTLGGGAYDFQAAGTTQAILLENVGPESGSSSCSVPGSYTTIIAGVNSDSYVQSSMLAAAGNAQNSVAQSRLVGGSAATGAPTSGTWDVLDIYTDASGTVWICTGAGTGSAATWVPSIAATGMPTACQSQGYVGWTSDPLGGTLLGAPASTTWTAGVLCARRVDVVPNIVANGYITFQWLTHASMANSYFSVWTLSGTTITIIGSTADQSSQTTGWHRIAVTGLVGTATPASGVLYVSYMNGTSGVAGGPYTERGAWSQTVPTTTAQLPPSNAGQYRWVTGGSGLTSPSSASPFSLSSGTSIGVLPFWCALD